MHDDLAIKRAKRAAYMRVWSDRQWNADNKHKPVIAGRRRYRRYATDSRFRVKSALRARIVALVRGEKSARTIALLGCLIEDFKIYIESKFEIGMSWENYGKGADKWNIDHIMPCAIFDLTKPEHQRRCFHFSNLQPLWEPDNIRKGAVPPTNQFALL